MIEEGKKHPWWFAEYSALLKATKIEREAKIAERAAATGKSGLIITPDWPHPKLSDIYRCLQMARQEPEIWEIAKKEALFPQEVWDSDYRSPINEYAGFFESWFRLKNGLDDTYPFPYSAIVPTLREMAHPDYDGDDLQVLRKILALSPLNYWIDDLLESSRTPEVKA